ncbi:carotenoid oxygenase family protein [Komagataeibacter nataicola]|uniref:carotenoid oxygenase family protein n=1 Tax=Komagataeibacter nataicola TaxID=265960 RepID=UPI0028A8F90D|nr:carotenoid oxygenase family protein [Komagataeibacter nataicola]WNM09854.1 carotenoid oxygenase family protein [Komagataeibacter nataicola]
MRTNRPPIEREIDARGLPLEGKLPSGLRGTLYRNGPNPRAGVADHHWFLGPGMIHAISLGEEQCAYRNRWVLPRDERGLGKANTHAIFHAGSIMALEEAHAPVALVPETLARTGATYAPGPFTAHPKHDPLTGELVFFGYAADGAGSRMIRCGALNRSGHRVWETRFSAPFCSMVHDVAVTSRHIALPILPLARQATSGNDASFAFAWHPELGGHLAVLARGACGDAVRWYEAPTVYAFHIVNAWEDRDRLYLDLFVYDAPPLFPGPQERIPFCQNARPCRWSVAHDGHGPVRVEPLHDMVGESGRIDDRIAGSRYSQIYCTSRRHPGAPGFQAVARLDLMHGAIDQFDFGSQAFVSEPVFVPRQHHAGPDDGWLLSLVWRPDFAQSRLVIFDAGHVADGPVASVTLPQRVPDGFHGSFVSDVFLDLERAL